MGWAGWQCATPRFQVNLKQRRVWDNLQPLFLAIKISQQDSCSAQQAMEVAQANLDNIDIYRQAKKCKN